jgi:hypothetical protein
LGLAGAYILVKTSWGSVSGTLDDDGQAWLMVAGGSEHVLEYGSLPTGALNTGLDSLSHYERSDEIGNTVSNNKGIDNLLVAMWPYIV